MDDGSAIAQSGVGLYGRKRGTSSDGKRVPQCDRTRRRQDARRRSERYFDKVLRVASGVRTDHQREARLRLLQENLSGPAAPLPGSYRPRGGRRLFGMEGPQHLDDDIEEEALREHRVKAMERLFQAKVFEGIEDGAGRKKKEAYRREVSFDECDCPKPARFYKAYACFREVYDYRDGEYMIDEVKAGRLVFKIRKDPDKVEAFFRFGLTLGLICGDIDELHGRRRVESVCDGVDFSSLHSRFSEEQAKASGIKNHADIVLALIDRMQREDIPKAHWIVFYCELVRRGWIEDNLAAFCKSMKALFDVNLDHRALSRNMKNLGDDINQWPEEDDRQRKKKAFGQDFRKLVEAYIEYKRNSILSDVQKLVPPKSHFDTTK